MTKKEWGFKKEREKLIKMVQSRLDIKKYMIPTAADIVDCVLVTWWDYEKKNAGGKG